MIFWIFVILTVLGIGFGIFIRVCAAKDNAAVKHYLGFDTQQEREEHKKTRLESLVYKIDTNCAGEWPDFAAWIVGITCLIVTLIMSICIIDAHVSAEAAVAVNEKRYESLVYQYENNIYDNDNDVVGKKQLFDEIQEWNEDLARYKVKQNNFWVGIFYADIFDQFEFIEYK